MLQGWCRTIDVHRYVTQQKLWKRLISVSHVAHQSAHAEGAHILKRPVEPGPEDCCQASSTSVLLHHVSLQQTCKRADGPYHCTWAKASTSSVVVHSILRSTPSSGSHPLLQSGCLNCVWEVYRLELEEYNRELAKRQGKPPPKPAVDPFAELERKVEEQKRQREELESSTPKAEKRTGHAQDAP